MTKKAESNVGHSSNAKQPAERIGHSEGSEIRDTRIRGQKSEIRDTKIRDIIIRDQKSEIRDIEIRGQRPEP